MPAQVSLGLAIGTRPRPRHHDDKVLTSGKPPQPGRHVPRRLRAKHERESRQPLAHRCRFVIDDVVDASSRAALEGECRCGGSVLNVDERPPTVAAADQRFPRALDLLDEATVEYASIWAIDRTIPATYLMSI